ncbi:MAG: acetyl-CoA carboxylase carboxyltransferase subunit alpha [Alphaproteobacteria bacterium]
MTKFLDFERPIIELEEKIEELKHIAHVDDLNITEEIARLQKKVNRLLKQTYAQLTPWQKVQIARHPDRPKFFDYLTLFDNFVTLSGDRTFADDSAIIGGIGKFNKQTVVVIGQQKGHDTESRLEHNFGMAKPEGYRKARRLMELAGRFSFPIITFVDTSGAYPGIDAEERGQAESIAKCLEVSFSVSVPIVSVVIGEGGSGGAIAIASANSILMLEHSIYSVISPEGCSSILWKTADKAYQAAEAQKLTAQDLYHFGVIDKIIEEPVGGAHRFKEQTLKRTKEALNTMLKLLLRYEGSELLQMRCDKFSKIGEQI